MTITSSGQATQGDSTTLTCYTDAVPTPTYMWVKVGEENRTLVGEVSNESSLLKIDDLEIARDSGEYK